VNDWRNAPIAAVFFNYRQGEEYEAELPGRVARGVVRKRFLLTIKDGSLVFIGTPDGSYRKGSDGVWFSDTESHTPTLRGGSQSASRGFGTGQSGKPSPEVSALLDSRQYSALSSHEDDPVLILGGAGCGKTTVALHRLATLNYRDPRRFAQHKMAVIVPDEGLVRLSRKLLDSLGLGRVLVSSFDKFFPERVYKIIRKLPHKLCEDPPSSVTYFKRHPALRTVLPDFIESQARDLAHDLLVKLPHAGDAAKILTDETNLPLTRRLAKARRLCEKSPGGDGQVFQSLERRALDISKDRIDLFMNRALLKTVVERSGGQIQGSAVDAVYRHSAAQFADAAAKRYSGVDLQSLETVDGGSLADEFEDDIAQTIDYEDFAIVYELRRLKLGLRRGDDEGLHQFSHLVIDEAQDLAPIELAALGAALTADGSVTIAGDSAQQIDPSTSFESWDAILDQIGVPRVQARHLTTTYRSPAPVAEFAHKVLGPYAPREMPKSIKDGVPVTVTLCPNEGHLMMALADSLSDLMVSEPLASVAVITRTEEAATRIFKMLSDVPKARLIHNGEFDFKPGVDVVDVTQVKGLEFDYVIIPDATPNAYPDSPVSRRLLHVAATRAIHQLWVLSITMLSKIVPGHGADE
jgi:DNA helicase-2/ATP-dependent DNA helicase PcrA